MKSERLLAALSGVDEVLLERSETRAAARSVARWMGLAAACVAVAVCGVLLFRGWGDTPGVAETPPPVQTVTPPSESPTVSLPAETIPPTPSGETGLHLLQLAQETPDFFIYVNEEMYGGTSTEEGYVIRALDYVAGELPECSLTISHLANTDLDGALALARTALGEQYDTLGETEESDRPAGLFFTAGDGWEWDAAQADATLVDDGAGGVFLLVSRYFTEATEGHGGRFTDMVRTFQVVDPSAQTAVWLDALQETVARLTPALFSGDLSQVSDLMAADAQVWVYEEDISGDVVVSGVDYTVDADEVPTSAVVSIRHRLGPENPFDYLTLELAYGNGAWQLTRSGLKG